MLLTGAGMFGLLFAINAGDRFELQHMWPMAVLVLANMGAFLLAGPSATRALGLFATIAAGLLGITALTSGAIALWAIVAIGLFNSIMWSNIFTLAIDGLGDDTPQGSSLLVMMIVGGALIPPLQGVLIDVMKRAGHADQGFHLSFLLPLLCYAYLAWYGFRGSRHSHVAA